MSSLDDEDYYVPLEDQRVFGAGIKRKRIAFVPAASATERSSIAKPYSTKQNAGDRYLSVVLKNKSLSVTADDNHGKTETLSASPEDPTTLCPVCGQHISIDDPKIPHESSIAHQVGLNHSHPPSHLDRSHVGLKYLQGYGWDPDTRAGLGARSDGIRIPIKAKQKNDNVGLGMSYDEEENVVKVNPTKQRKVEEKPTRLNAKVVREVELEKSRRAERLRRDMYGQDLSYYLGPDG